MSVIKRHGTARPSAAEAGKGADGGTCGDRQRTRKSSLVRKGFSIVLLSVAAGGMKYQKTAGSRPKSRYRQMTSTRRKTNHCLPFQALQAMREVFEMADDALHKISLQCRAGNPRRGRWMAPPCGRAMRGGAAPRRTTIERDLERESLDSEDERDRLREADLPWERRGIFLMAVGQGKKEMSAK